METLKATPMVVAKATWGMTSAKEKKITSRILKTVTEVILKTTEFEGRNGKEISSYKISWTNKLNTSGN